MIEGQSTEGGINHVNPVDLVSNQVWGTSCRTCTTREFCV